MHISLNVVNQLTPLIITAVVYDLVAGLTIDFEQGSSDVEFMTLATYLNLKASGDKRIAGKVVVKSSVKEPVGSFDAYLNEDLVKYEIDETEEDDSIDIISSKMFDPIIKASAPKDYIIAVFNPSVTHDKIIKFHQGLNQAVVLISKFNHYQRVNFLNDNLLVDEELLDYLADIHYQIAMKITLDMYKDVKKAINLKENLNYNLIFVR